MNSMGPMDDDDEDIARMLRSAGLRREPSAATRARLHASALAVFDALPAQIDTGSSATTPATGAAAQLSRGVLPRRAYAIAAAFALATLGALWWQTKPVTPLPVIATVNYGNGAWLVDDRASPDDLAQPLPLQRGARVRTLRDAALELRLHDGALLRADQDTLFVLSAERRIELLRGRIYIDARGAAQSVRVATQYAIVRDIGTQFEVKVDHTALTVAVREGQVQLEGDHIRLTRGEPVTAAARDGVGESVRIDAAGRIVRGRVATTASEWHWLRSARSGYALARGSLHDFLEWSAAESGLELRYRSDAVRRAAIDTRVRGSIDGMSPEDAIANVLATTRLRRAAAATHELLVDFADGD